LDKNNNTFSTQNTTENVNGIKTVDGFNTYQSIKNQKFSFDKNLLIVYLVILVLLITSVFVFASSIYTVYSNDDSTTSSDGDSSFTKVKAVYQTNGSLKIQQIDSTIAEIYEIPVGVKIIEIDHTNPLFNGLKVGDIIVSCAGKDVFSINDLNFNTPYAPLEEHFISYKIFRNGIYRTIIPFEE